MTLEQLLVKHRLHSDIIDIIFGTTDKPYSVIVNIEDNHIFTLTTDINWLDIVIDIDLEDITKDISLILKNIYSILKILYPKR